MFIPFSYSLENAALDIFGVFLMSQIPQETLDTLQQYWIVDAPGMIVWTLLTLAFGIYVGRTSKRTKTIKQSDTPEPSYNPEG